MPSYKIESPTLDDPLKTLRILFFTSNGYDFVPAVYCDEYYRDEIKAELSG